MTGVQLPARAMKGAFLFTAVPRLALVSTQPPIQWVPGALSPGVKQLKHEAEHLPISSAEVKNAWSYTSTPPYTFMTWCLIKQGIHLHGMVLS